MSKTFTSTSVRHTKDAAQVDHEYGYDVGGNVGYDFGMFRVEAEVAYKSANVDNWRSTLRTPAFNAAGGAVFAVPGSFNYAGGKTTALSFMLNGMLDFGDDDGIQGFVGGGVGVARVKADKYALNTLRLRSSTIRTPCSHGRRSPAFARRSPTTSTRR